MFITGLGTATPPTRYTQIECWEAAQSATQFSRLNLRSRAILKKVLRGDNGIDSRHLALDSLTEVFDLTPDALHARFIKHAPELATQAAERALQDAGLSSPEIDAVIISTCTGYLCPGLTSYVSERLRLRADTLCLDLVGQGCGAAIPNLRTGEALLASGRCRQVLSICVEVCSAAFYLDNDPGVLISACLFGDGAGAAILASQTNPKRRPVKWKAVLSAAGVTREQIGAWIWHAGGREVLLALRKKLKLSEADVCHSAAVLRELGNISSPCVYFVLQATLADNAPGGLWWMSSFGAGFSCHGALLEVD